jgi:hypothetical protein
MTGRTRPAGLALLACVLGAGALADAPSRSLVPLARGSVAAVAETAAATGLASTPARAATALAPRASLRPLARGGSVALSSRDARPATASAAAAALALAADVPPPATTRPAAVTASTAPVAQSPRPSGRPEDLSQSARATATRQTPGRVTQPGTPGTLCGIPGLSGDRLEPFTGRSAGCGIAEPVRLRVVDGIPLTTPATINCDTARALRTWVREGLVPAVGQTGGGVANLRVVASYACRTRNSQTGARLSEHARGNAIDIAGIGLANGEELSVLSGWGNGREGRILREAHSSACGTFGTVLGPNSDRFHRDHFHFDVASYRSGAYCR